MNGDGDEPNPPLDTEINQIEQPTINGPEVNQQDSGDPAELLPQSESEATQPVATYDIHPRQMQIENNPNRLQYFAGKAVGSISVVYVGFDNQT